MNAVLFTSLSRYRDNIVAPVIRWIVVASSIKHFFTVSCEFKEIETMWINFVGATKADFGSFGPASMEESVL